MLKAILAAGIAAYALSGAALAADSLTPIAPAPFEVAIGGYASPTVGCVKGFNKLYLHQDGYGWDTLICQTNIIECPRSTRPTVSISPEIVNLGIGDKGTRYRFKYTCIAYTPAG